MIPSAEIVTEAAAPATVCQPEFWPAKGELDLFHAGAAWVVGGVKVDGDIRVVPAVGIGAR